MSREILTSGLIEAGEWTGSIIESNNPNQIGVSLNIPFLDQARHIFCASTIPDLEAFHLGFTWAETFDEKSQSVLAGYLCEAYVILWAELIFSMVKNGQSLEDSFGKLRTNKQRKNAWRVISHYWNEISPKGFSGTHLKLEWQNYATAKELGGLTVGFASSQEGILFNTGAKVLGLLFA